MADTPKHDVSTAIVTASYHADFERCRLLCETVDRHMTGHKRHLLLVADRDEKLFAELRSSRREVIPESAILPGWLRDIPDPLSLFRRRVWVSPKTPPLRGWHVQQLRRIAIAGHVQERGLLYCDSDVAFVRDFDCASLYRDGKIRLFRRDGRLLEPGHDKQTEWARRAGRALGLPDGSTPRHDYIATVIAWDVETVRAMTAHIEAVTGKHWIAGASRGRHLSECMLYGRYADEVVGGAGHFHDGAELCHIYWNGPRLAADGVRSFLSGLAPEQVAIGLQSFTGIDVSDIRQALAAA